MRLSNCCLCSSGRHSISGSIDWIWSAAINSRILCQKLSTKSSSQRLSSYFNVSYRWLTFSKMRTFTMWGLLTWSFLVKFAIFEGEWILAVLSVNFKYNSCSSLGRVVLIISEKAVRTNSGGKRGRRLKTAITLIRVASQETSMSIFCSHPWTKCSN